MIPVIRDPRAFLFHGDSAALPLKPNSVDAIVCDPPAGIGFMGKAWDGNKGGRDKWIAWLAATLGPAFTALKPGGYALVWALPRTSHWTALALEMAGFIVRDRLGHLFGNGFPKSATAKSAGIPEGRGTALKPACEDWWLVQKPFKGTIAANVAQHGTGAMNIDACRVGDASGDTDGRWPPHVILGHLPECRVVGTETETIAKNTEAVGEQHTEGWGTRKMATVDVELTVDVFECADGCSVALLGDRGRYYYCPKPSTSEREIGCEALPLRSGGEATGRKDGSDGLKNPRAGAGRGGGRRNDHPTVKGIELMRYLVRLITPPGGVVLDPFAGSGTTALAALVEGCRFIGCEQDPQHIHITKARVEHALKSTAQ